jgi:hypothetical protein
MESITVSQLHFKWTISRGRDTYGYNICTLLVDGRKAASCTGGGYDMQGTCLGNSLQGNFQEALRSRFSKELAAVTPEDYKAYSGNCYKQVDGFYGLRISGKEGKLSLELDGGCGFSSMEKIANAIGIRLQWNPESDRYKNHSYYTAFIGAYPEGGK